MANPQMIFHTTDHADRELGVETNSRGDVEIYIVSAREPRARVVELDSEQIADLHAALGALLLAKQADIEVEADPSGTSSPFGPIVDPCAGCGCAKAWHREYGCAGDFMFCPCKTWMPLNDWAPGGPS